MSLDKRIAERISSLRQGLGLTQENLAELCEMDVSSIVKIERGVRANIKVNTLEKILNGLQISPIDFSNVDVNEVLLTKLDIK